MVEAEIIQKNEVAIRDCDILNMEYGFDEKIDVATKVATSLKNVIEKQNLAIKISSGNYVTVEGWNTLGTMLGCTAYVEEVEDISSDKKTMYKATVSIRQGDKILSRASAIAERNNSQREKFAVYSMAQTRATGKAYRMAFSWIVKMAGYDVTPAEEMEIKEKKPIKEVIPKEVKK